MHDNIQHPVHSGVWCGASEGKNGGMECIVVEASLGGIEGIEGTVEWGMTRVPGEQLSACDLGWSSTLKAQPWKLEPTDKVGNVLLSRYITMPKG